MKSHEGVVQNPWSPILVRAAWWTLGIAILFGILSSIFHDPISNYLSYSSASSVLVTPISSSVGGLILMSIAAFVLANALKTVPPLENTKFWVKRAISDSVIALFIIPLLLIPITGPIISILELDFGDKLMGSDGSLKTFLSSFSLSNVEIPPVTFFLMVTLAQFGLGAVVLIRKLFNALPVGTLQISLKNLKRDFGIVMLCIVPLITASFLYDFALTSLGVEIPQQFVFTDELRQQFWLVLLGGVIGASMFEELFFRGYLLPVMSAKNRWTGLIISSLIFASIHMSLVYFVPLFVGGFVLGLSYLKTKNILVPMTIHALNNLVAFIGLLLIQGKI